MFEGLITRHRDGRLSCARSLKLGAALAVEAGAEPEAVAAVLGCSRSAVSKWHASAKKKGFNHVSLAKMGRPRLVSREVLECVKKDLKRPPYAFGYTQQTWSGSLLRMHLRRIYDLVVSHGTGQACMEAAGMRYLKARRRLSEPQIRARRAAKALVRKALGEAEGQTWFVDEAWFQLEGPSTGLWVHDPGSALAFERFVDKRSSCLMFGALRDDGFFIMEERDAANSTATIEFLKKVMIHERVERPVRIVWDNASWHKSRAVREWLAVLRDCEVICLPPYCSCLSPIEGVWALLKAECLELDKSLDELRTALHSRASHWRKMNDELPKVIAAFASSRSLGGLTRDQYRLLPPHSKAASVLRQTAPSPGAA